MMDNEGMEKMEVMEDMKDIEDMDHVKGFGDIWKVEEKRIWWNSMTWRS